MFHPQRHYLTVTLTLLKKERLHNITAAEDCTCIWTKLTVDVVLESETTALLYDAELAHYPRLPAKQHSSTSPEAW
jgi:hypothetical protein